MYTKETKKLLKRARAYVTLIEDPNTTEFERGLFKKGFANTIVLLTKPAIETAIPELSNYARPIADIEVKADGSINVVQIAEEAFA